MHDCDVHETLYPVKFMAPGFQVGASHMVKIKQPNSVKTISTTKIFS